MTMSTQVKKASGVQEEEEKSKAQPNKKVSATSQPGEDKSKAQLKAERRAQQEAQRAKKAATKQQSTTPQQPPRQQTTTTQPPRKEDFVRKEVKEMPRIPDSRRIDDDKVRKRQEKNLTKQGVPARTHTQKTVALFSHLAQYEREVSLSQGLKNVHPAFVNLGSKYYEKEIIGSNARCIALLNAMLQFIKDFQKSAAKDLSRDLNDRLKPNISFLTQCRPMSVSMGQAVKYLKQQITTLPSDMSQVKAKEQLENAIISYVHERIVLAGVAISRYTQECIDKEDVLLVYACSSLIERVLYDALKSGKKIKVIVVDSRPRYEGKEFLKRLLKQSSHPEYCCYCLISAVPYIMPQVSKVLLGAHALLANGYVMSRCGSSQIAMVAKAYNKPVLVCCETYKFSERVQTDSVVFNELMDPDELVSADLSSWRDQRNLGLLNTMYDVTPDNLIAEVVTEIGVLPCSSVPVVLRVKHSDQL